jgi:hypothetical protein
MKFFIPDIASPELAEEELRSIKALLKTTLGWDATDRRIFRIKYNHNGRHLEAQVGKITKANNELVIAILESNAFLICTPSRGAGINMPLLVGTDEVISIEDFED